ncbi:MAG: adenylate/guanylate cyclase domain-containing protein [Verrucomicrobia bacterium]|nr:adenylate/guanylate cyclase domain-containing protein [Verrucomicrobiota bacterium]
MPTLSFRIKLVLAMMFIVAGVTATTLFLTSRKINTTYQDLFERQFEAQIETFTEAQELRLEPFSALSKLIAQSPRVIAALRSTNIDAALLYSNSVPDLQAYTDEGPRSPRQPRASYWGFLDARGRTIQPPRGLGLSESGKRFQEQMTFARLAMSSKDKQEIGYTPPPGKDHRGQPHEVIFTKIIDPQAKKVLGALVVGFPLPDQEQRALVKVSRIATGILIGTNIFSKTIPAELLKPVADLVAADVKHGQHAHRDLTVKVGGVPHRVFYTPMNEESEFPTAYQVGLFSLREVFEQEADLQTKVLAFGAAMLLAALVLSLILANGFALPLQMLVRATEEIQRENYDFKVPVRSRDELGKLAESFNRMADGLALRDKYFNVLSMVADKDVADELLKGRIALGGELREVTILFCDIRGFSALTQAMPPQEVIALLNEHMTALTEVVHANGGVVDKFMGDNLMALFGAPKSTPRDAVNAARCAQQMLAERTRLNAGAKHQIAVGIGIATGTVVAGCMGSKERVDYTVLGERVNLGARLCTHAGPMEILLDDATRAKLGEQTAVEQLPALRLKGFTDPVPAWRLG